MGEEEPPEKNVIDMMPHISLRHGETENEATGTVPDLMFLSYFVVKWGQQIDTPNNNHGSVLWPYQRDSLVPEELCDTAKEAQSELKHRKENRWKTS